MPCRLPSHVAPSLPYAPIPCRPSPSPMLLHVLAPGTTRAVRRLPMLPLLCSSFLLYIKPSSNPLPLPSPSTPPLPFFISSSTMSSNFLLQPELQCKPAVSHPPSSSLSPSICCVDRVTVCPSASFSTSPNSPLSHTFFSLQSRFSCHRPNHLPPHVPPPSLIPRQHCHCR